MFPGKPAAYRDYKQRWWYEKRPAQVEAEAYALLRRYEVKHGAIPGCVVPPEFLVEEVGCELVYFADDERGKYELPPDVIGALSAADGRIFVYQHLEVIGREWHTIGEELGHMVLHAFEHPEQPGLGLEMPSDKTPKYTRFYRTPTSVFVDERREPAYMTVEAGFFAACIEMPRDRYGAVAETRLREALKHHPRQSAVWRSLDSKLASERNLVQVLERQGVDLHACNVLSSGGFDNAAIEAALDLLKRDHKGKVSWAAQKRRLVELGLAVDAADAVRTQRGETFWPLFEFFFLTDRVTGAACGGATET